MQVLGSHIVRCHRDTTREEYYKKYLMTTSTKLDCPSCGKPKKFFTLGQGYRLTCGNKVCVQATAHDRTPEERKEQHRKASSTCLIKYGSENYFKTQRFKDQIRIRRDEIQRKVYATKRKNKTFKTSKPESTMFDVLKNKFPDVLNEYKDEERYPFKCDFYIPSLDLFIELQYHWSHGFRKFDINNKKDRDQSIMWFEKSLNSKFYKEALHVWTERDVMKRNTAYVNRIKYLEIFPSDVPGAIEKIKEFIEKR